MKTNRFTRWSILLLSVTGCSNGDHPPSRVPSNSSAYHPSDDSETVRSPQIAWDAAEVESYFKVISPPTFDAAENAFVVTLEAREAGNCVLAPSVPSGFFGFEAILFDDENNKIHYAYDIGSASKSAWPAKEYSERMPRRICVEPPRWSAGTQIRLTIAAGVDPTVLSRVRHGKISAI